MKKIVDDVQLNEVFGMRPLEFMQESASFGTTDDPSLSSDACFSSRNMDTRHLRSSSESSFGFRSFSPWPWFLLLPLCLLDNSAVSPVQTHIKKSYLFVTNGYVEKQSFLRSNLKFRSCLLTWVDCFSLLGCKIAMI